MIDHLEEEEASPDRCGLQFLRPPIREAPVVSRQCGRYVASARPGGHWMNRERLAPLIWPTEHSHACLITALGVPMRCKNVIIAAFFESCRWLRAESRLKMARVFPGRANHDIRAGLRPTATLASAIACTSLVPGPMAHDFSTLDYPATIVGPAARACYPGLGHLAHRRIRAR